jgi:hypothetical protein
VFYPNLAIKFGSLPLARKMRWAAQEPGGCSPRRRPPVSVRNRGKSGMAMQWSGGTQRASPACDAKCCCLWATPTSRLLSGTAQHSGAEFPIFLFADDPPGTKES